MNISNQKLGIGIPNNFSMVPSAFFDSWIMMDFPPFVYLRTSQGPIDDMRNEIVRNAFNSGCTHLIMLDVDQIYGQDTIRRLLSHNKDIVGCMICRRYPPFDPLMLRGKINSYQTVKEWTPGELVEVDATGTGCLLFSMEVFRKVPEPWFEFDHRDTGTVGEDIGFCAKARAVGYQVFVDTGCAAGHLSNMLVTEDTWRLYSCLQDAKARHKVEHGIVKTKAA
jgi:hypothetical protein